MFKELQDFFPWAANLGVPAKILISATFIFLTGFVLVLIWTTPVPPPNPQLQPAHEPLWPEQKTLEALRHRLDQMSEINRLFLREVAHSGKHGLYVNDLAKRMNLKRDEVVYRGKDLEHLDLVEILDLTDKNYRVSADVWKVLGSSGVLLLDPLLS